MLGWKPGVEHRAAGFLSGIGPVDLEVAGRACVSGDDGLLAPAGNAVSDRRPSHKFAERVGPQPSLPRPAVKSPLQGWRDLCCGLPGAAQISEVGFAQRGGHAVAIVPHDHAVHAADVIRLDLDLDVAFASRRT